MTACYWRILQCQVAFDDPTCDPSHVALQFYGREAQKSVQNGVFFVIMQQGNSFLYRRNSIMLKIMASSQLHESVECFHMYFQEYLYLEMCFPNLHLVLKY